MAIKIWYWIMIFFIILLIVCVIYGFVDSALTIRRAKRNINPKIKKKEKDVYHVTEKITNEECIEVEEFKSFVRQGLYNENNGTAFYSDGVFYYNEVVDINNFKKYEVSYDYIVWKEK